MNKVKRTARTVKMSSSSFKYRGSVFWLIFFLIIFFPIGLVLLMKNLARVKTSTTSYLEYGGSWKWVFFWAIFFFPIAFILLFFNGLSLIEEQCETINIKQTEEEIIIDRQR
ncbi:MAG: hypothetical protein COY39_05315 [Alphaproteobacteria bacterium CG_4_10_14_0_8_um_filter_37_21]|nr:MAG: hypothetical protein COY39_05315 [Alphaproteobacteria bacterium CG_4_10_14_0_8_um_filter_37_21]